MISEEIGALLPLTHLTYHIMLTVRREPLHGYAISKAVAELSQGRVAPGTGTFYSALRRMMEEGMLEEVDQPHGVDGNDSRRRFYALTDLGRAVLDAERARLQALLTLDGPDVATAG
jgi:DNA-binding PadR family transcriptional regulator